MEAVLQAKAVPIQPHGEQFADRAQQKYVKQQRNRVMTGNAKRNRLQTAAPAGGQEHAQKSQPQQHVDEFQPPPDVVVLPRLRGIDIVFVWQTHGFFRSRAETGAILNSRVNNLAVCAPEFVSEWPEGPSQTDSPARR